MPLQDLQDQFGLCRQVWLGKLLVEVMEGQRDIPKLWFLPRRNGGDPCDVVPYLMLSSFGWAVRGALEETKASPASHSVAF